MNNVTGVVFCPGGFCARRKCVRTWKEIGESCYESPQFRACCHFLNILFSGQRSTVNLIGADGAFCLARKTNRDLEAEKQSPLL